VAAVIRPRGDVALGRDSRELADTIYERCCDGVVRVVIACDIAPETAPNLVSAIGLQASLGFELKLVEVVPYSSGDEMKSCS